MKIPLVILVLASGLLVSAQSNAPDAQQYAPLPDGAQVGRFQLVAAAVCPGDVASKSIPVLFRIDTATGAVWKYSVTDYPLSGGQAGKTITTEGWLAVPEDIVKSLKLAAAFDADANTNTLPAGAKTGKQ